MKIRNQVLMKPLISLIPYIRNNKTHPASQINLLVANIKEFGFNVPILIDKFDNIIAGHCRLLAAQKLEIGEVPCLLVDDLSESQIKALRIADNRIAELAETDWEMLKLEMDELKDLDYDISITGYEIDDIDIMVEPGEVKDVEPEDAETIETDIKPGDIYQLGNHRLMCGDSTDKETVEKLMNSEKADMVFTDPPWNVNYVNHTDYIKFKHREIKNDNLTTEDFKAFMDHSFACMKTSCKLGSMIYVVMSAQEWGNVMLSMKENEFHWSSTIIWNKSSLILSRKDYHTKYEPIWYGWSDGESRLNPLKDRQQSDVWDIDKTSRSDEHPTMKPIELCVRAINNSSKQDNIVLDQFGGSGSTLIACENTKRKCYMMELDPQYVQVIINRWEKLTGENGKKII